MELNLLVLTLQDHWLESTFCKLSVPSSMFSQCPILGLSKFPLDHQSFAKRGIVIAGKQKYSRSYAITCHIIKLELQKKNNISIQRTTQGHQDHRLQERARVHL